MFGFGKKKSGCCCESKHCSSNSVSIKVKKTADDVTIPEYKTQGAAGADIYAYIKESIVLAPHSTVLIPTGLIFEIPQGYEVQIRSRSGLALKNGVIVLNSPGTIDSDYRGEIGVILYNSSSASFTINPNDRIAQAVLAKVEIMNFDLSSSLTSTTRSQGGFGSTNV